MYQLLSDNIAVLPWKKSLIVKDNWYKQDRILKGDYINSKHYSFCKSITGDKSDNIIGVKNIGWKKVSKLISFIYNEYGNDVDIETIEDFIDKLNIIKEKENIVKKDKEFIENMLLILNNNKELIRKNFSIIDFNSIEVPYIYQCIIKINNLFEEKLSFDKNKFYEYLHLDRYKGEDCYEEIQNKNTKNLFILYGLIKKFNNTLERLKNNV